MAGVSDPDCKMSERSNLPPTQPATYETTASYFKALEKWLQCAQNQQHAMAIPHILFYYYYCMQQTAMSYPHLINNSTQRQFLFHSPVVDIQGQPNQRRNQEQRDIAAEIQYRIAPVWKRIAAQTVDFVFLCFIKLLAGITTAYIFGWIKWNLFNQSRMWAFDMTLDSVLLWLESDEITPDLILLEILNVAVDALYETFWMQLNFFRLGKGRTLGKAMMKIKVVHCKKVASVVGRPEGVVLVQPGTDVKFLWCLARSFVKNIVLSMLLPLTFILFFFKHHRTGYDIMCHTIVVEDSTNVPR